VLFMRTPRLFQCIILLLTLINHIECKEYLVRNKKGFNYFIISGRNDKEAIRLDYVTKDPSTKTEPGRKEQDDHPHCQTHDWSYKKKTKINKGGHSDFGLEMENHVWEQKFPICGGKSQSPVNLNTSIAEKLSGGNKSSSLILEGYKRAGRLNASLINNGHSVKLNVQHLIGLMKGGPLSQPYELLQLHFHWGSTDKRGSEHTIDGVRYPLEMHLVHRKVELRNEHICSLDDSEALSVLSFLFEVSSTDNSALSPITDSLELVTRPEDQIEMQKDFNLESLISAASQSPYFSYDGSLTTPTCNQVVKWIVFTKKLGVSTNQLEKFRALKDKHGDSMADNFRALQGLHGRKLTLIGV